MYPSKVDEQHRAWAEEVLQVSNDTHSDAAEIVVAACEYAINSLISAKAPGNMVEDMNAYHLDLVLFKDRGIVDILSKYVQRMNSSRLVAFVKTMGIHFGRRWCV